MSHRSARRPAVAPTWISSDNTPSAGERPRFLSEAECHDIAHRLAQVAQGGGYTVATIVSTWSGNVRWARNQISTGGDVCNNTVMVTRNLQGADGEVIINKTTTAALTVAAREAERIAGLNIQKLQSDLVTRLPLESHDMPQLFSEATYQLDADRRADAAVALTRASVAHGVLAAGDIVVTARSMAVIDSFGRTLYFPYTQAQYRATVRTPTGTGSGWAGVDHYDWAKIDAEALTATALDKCLRSQNPVRVEPGRYTTILEPQAVGDFVGCLISPPDLMGDPMGLYTNLYPSSRGPGPFFKLLPTESSPGATLLGERVVDERVTIGADPADLELGIPPFGLEPRIAVDKFTVPVYHKVNWIENGVLTHLSYDRAFAIEKGETFGLPNSGAFRMSGGTTSIEEMIATTKRGILVTRFDTPLLIDFRSQLYRGYTRDGLWLIENGKVSKAIKNLVFTESILFALNNIEQLGVPQRVYHASIPFWWSGPQPRIVPPLKVRDFSFTALTDAV
jgi:predicted Zn-dependent protease